MERRRREKVGTLKSIRSEKTDQSKGEKRVISQKMEEDRKMRVGLENTRRYNAKKDKQVREKQKEPP